MLHNKILLQVCISIGNILLYKHMMNLDKNLGNRSQNIWGSMRPLEIMYKTE